MSASAATNLPFFLAKFSGQHSTTSKPNVSDFVFFLYREAARSFVRFAALSDNVGRLNNTPNPTSQHLTPPLLAGLLCHRLLVSHVGVTMLLAAFTPTKVCRDREQRQVDPLQDGCDRMEILCCDAIDETLVFRLLITTLTSGPRCGVTLAVDVLKSRCHDLDAFLDIDLLSIVRRDVAVTIAEIRLHRREELG